MGARWTEAEEHLAVKLRTEGLSLEAIAGALGRRRGAVAERLQDMGFYKRAPRRTLHCSVTDVGPAIPPQRHETLTRREIVAASEELARATAAAILRYANDNGLTDVEAINRLLYAGEVA